MSVGRDGAYIYHINVHYRDIVKDSAVFRSFDDFRSGGMARKSVLFDLFQIGENLSHLSAPLVAKVGHDIVREVVDFRNHVVHGYSDLDDETVYEVLKNELVPFVERLNRIALEDYRKTLLSWLGQKIKVIIDCRLGETIDGVEYLCNCGYVEDLMMLTCQKQFAYVLGVDIGVRLFKGIIYAIIRNGDRNFDELVVIPEDACMSKEDIIKAIAFKETCTADDIILAE